MTFAEYNTDEYFKNDNSSADGLIKTAFNEGKTRQEVENSLSPLWKEDKKGNVKKALDTYYKTETPKAEETTTEKTSVTETPEENKTTLTKSEKTYNDKQNKIAEAAKEEMLSDIKKDSERNWKDLYDSSVKRADAYKSIDDHYLESLPTFIFRRFQNGEFGDTSTKEGKKDAKLRMAYFMINGLGTALNNVSNVIKGRQLEQSDYEKYKESQMAQGLENRWAKNKADTEGAIKAVEKEYGNEQDARLAAEQFTRDRKANTKWNMMDQNQKVYALQVTKDIGDMLGGMDTSELANFIAGSALTGDMSKDELIAVGVAKLAANSPNILANLPEGNIKDMVMGMIGGDIADVTAGIGSAGSNNGGAELSDGSKVDPGITMDDKEYSELAAKADKLSQDYFDGKITEEQFRTDYDKLVGIMKKHPVYKLKSGKTIKDTNTIIKENRTNKLNSLDSLYQKLNSDLADGVISKSDYDEQYDNLIANAKQWGATSKMIKALEKNRKK